MAGEELVLIIELKVDIENTGVVRFGTEFL